jgi:uncharacterized protein YabE (DUF348 family)
MKRSPGGPARFLKTRYLIALAVAALLTLAAITGFVWAKERSVSIIEDGRLTRYTTEAADVASLLEEAGVAVADGDLVNPTLDTLVEDGLTVTVRHAVPVTLMLAGEPMDLAVVGSTVADALVSVGLDPESGLDVRPSIDTPLEAGMTIFAADVFLRVIQEEIEIPFETTTIDDPDMDVGVREIRTAGVPGRTIRIYEAVVTDGAEGARTLTAERIIEQPVDEIVAVGTRRVVAPSLVSRGTERFTAPAPESGTEMTVESSAYTPGVDCGYYTATGAAAGYGIIAVDPSVIPLGTRLYVPGYGYGIAADTGGAIKGYRIDVCFDTLSEAISWGRRTVTITIVD